MFLEHSHQPFLSFFFFSAISSPEASGLPPLAYLSLSDLIAHLHQFLPFALSSPFTCPTQLKLHLSLLEEQCCITHLTPIRALSSRLLHHQSLESAWQSKDSSLSEDFCLQHFFFLNLFMGGTQRGRDKGRGRSRFPAGSPRWNSIPGPWDADLSQRQTLNH